MRALPLHGAIHRQNPHRAARLDSVPHKDDARSAAVRAARAKCASVDLHISRFHGVLEDEIKNVKKRQGSVFECGERNIATATEFCFGEDVIDAAEPALLFPMPPKNKYEPERVKLADKSTVSVSLNSDSKGAFTLEQLREYARALGFKEKALANALTAAQQSDVWARLKRHALRTRKWY
ncbi:MAG: hypothetical protein SGPRY_001157 [Prymnesium sp.]